MDPPVPSSLVEAWLSLLDNERVSDVVFQLGEECIHAQKSLLSARCSYFEALFTNGMRESQEVGLGEDSDDKGNVQLTIPKKMVVQVTDFSYDTFYAMLAYLYSNRLNFADYPTVTERDLFKIADKYGLIELKSAMQECILDNLSCDNVTRELFEFGYQYDTLRKACLDFVGRNFAEVRRAEASFVRVLAKEQEHEEFVKLMSEIISIAPVGGLSG